MSEYDPFLAYMEERCQVNDPLDMDEPDNDSDRFEQTIRSVASAYYHCHIVQEIANRIGPGEPLDVILRDASLRSTFHLKPRQL
jgi:hypothetical protein